MATSSRKPRPAVVMLIFLFVIGLMYTIMAATTTWAPKLGLDLRGGMTITLTAKNPQVSAESLELAKNIMQQRVDGLGVGEATVAVSGDRNIVVSAPNIQRDDLVDLVGATAQLSFRRVLLAAPATAPQSSLPPLPFASDNSEGKRLPIDQVLAYQATPADQQAFATYKCGDPVPDKLDQPTVACDPQGTQKYLLGPVAIAGSQVTGAQSGMVQGEIGFGVNLSVDQQGTGELLKLTTFLASKANPTDPNSTENMFAILLDGKVESAATVREPIPGGSARISGNSFTPESAAKLANILKFGALPLTFQPSQVESVSATLGGEQLRIGLLAGLIGLIVVIVYCFIYYRGLGLVVVGSLAVAALATYAAMVLLGQAVGFTLSLPAIAGAIVAIGVTADSFVIYFERIRDEIRDGRSLQSALQTGWVKARSTIIVADLVSLLSATVLYILAVGGVKGFAFALGLTTLIDLAVCFFFTKPLVTMLGRTKFFGQGHKLSGLDASHMGVSRDSLLGRRSRRTTKLAKETL